MKETGRTTGEKSGLPCHRKSYLYFLFRNHSRIKGLEDSIYQFSPGRL